MPGYKDKSARPSARAPAHAAQSPSGGGPEPSVQPRAPTRAAFLPAPSPCNWETPAKRRDRHLLEKERNWLRPDSPTSGRPITPTTRFLTKPQNGGGVESVVVLPCSEEQGIIYVIWGLSRQLPEPRWVDHRVICLHAAIAKEITKLALYNRVLVSPRT